MRNVPDSCVRKTTDSIIKFQELRSIIRFHNSQRSLYKKVKIDGGALHEGAKCDNMLCSADEHDGNRHSYVVCTKVAPRITTAIQKAKVEFRKRLKSDLQIKETPLDVQL